MMRLSAHCLLILIVFCPAALVGCNREQPAMPASNASTAEPTGLADGYTLLKMIDPATPGLAGIALDTQDTLYAAGAKGVKVWSAGGQLLREWTLSKPATCIALDEDGNAYVGQQTRIEVFDRDGKPLRAWGKEGRGSGEFGYVTGIAVHKTDVLVADAGNRCIHRFDLTGDFIGDIGKRDPEAGVTGIICPSPFLDVSIDKSGELLVTNPGLTRVERYGLDGKLVRFWGEGGNLPHQFPGCCNPTAIAVMEDGRVVTGEKLVGRVKVHDEQGKLMAFIGPRHFTPHAVRLDVAVDSTGRLLVSDGGDGKIRVFERKK